MEDSFVGKLISLINIGKEIEEKLRAVGINTADELRKVGSKEAFFRLKMQYPNVCLVHLYTLEGAIFGIPFNQLSEEMKRDLKEYGDGLKQVGKERE